MFYVILTYPNILNRSVFVSAVNSVALKWQQIDTK